MQMLGLLSSTDAEEKTEKPATPTKGESKKKDAEGHVETEKKEEPDQDDEEEEAVELNAKYLIIGGGTAAYSALKAILENDPNSNANVSALCVCGTVPNTHKRR